MQQQTAPEQIARADRQQPKSPPLQSIEFPREENQRDLDDTVGALRLNRLLPYLLDLFALLRPGANHSPVVDLGLASRLSANLPIHVDLVRNAFHHTAPVDLVDPKFCAPARSYPVFLGHGEHPDLCTYPYTHSKSTNSP